MSILEKKMVTGFVDRLTDPDSNYSDNLPIHSAQCSCSEYDGVFLIIITTIITVMVNTINLWCDVILLGGVYVFLVSFFFTLFSKKKTSIFMTSCFFIHSKSCCMPAPFLERHFAVNLDVRSLINF